MDRTLLRHLAQMELIYRTGRSPEELAELSEIFEEDLACENPQSVKAAFALHRRTSSRFPTPADILKILPECRVLEKRQPLEAGTAVEKPASGDFVRDLWEKKRREWHGEPEGNVRKLNFNEASHISGTLGNVFGIMAANGGGND